MTDQISRPAMVVAMARAMVARYGRDAIRVAGNQIVGAKPHVAAS